MKIELSPAPNFPASGPLGVDEARILVQWVREQADTIKPEVEAWLHTLAPKGVITWSMRSVGQLAQDGVNEGGEWFGIGSAYTGAGGNAFIAAIGVWREATPRLGWKKIRPLEKKV